MGTICQYKQELDLSEFDDKDPDLTCEICAAEFTTADKKDLHMESKHSKFLDGGAVVTVNPKASKKKVDNKKMINKYKNKA